MDKNLIWATDGSEGADNALPVALGLSKTSGARIVAVHVNQRLVGRAGNWPALPDEDDRLLKLRRQVKLLREEGVDIDLVVRRTATAPAHVLAAVGKEFDADMIVCGTHGRGALTGAVLGSVAHALLHEATCPVLVVPERARAHAQPMVAEVEA